MHVSHDDDMNNTSTRTRILAEQAHKSEAANGTTWVFNVWEDGTFDAVQVVVLVSDLDADWDALHIGGNVLDTSMLRPSHNEWPMWEAICEARI